MVQPSRARTLGGGEPNLGLLVLVGVVFAALGVGLTLWFMLHGTGEATNAGAAPSAEPVEPPFPGYQRPHSPATTHPASTGLGPAPTPGAPGGIATSKANPHTKTHGSSR